MKKSYTFWLSEKFLPFLAIILVVAPLLVMSSSNNAAAACISYSSSSRTITISCTSTTHLATVNGAINNVNVLKKESTGVWLLAANVVIAKGANLVIDSTDGTWLKISSGGSVAYGLKNSGTLTISSIKITSWNTATNNYASPGSSGNTPRAYIVTLNTATGKTNILNSEIAYLGYSGTGHHGLDYYSGAYSLIQNNQIHHLWRAFYSSGVGGITFTKNVVHDNTEYGIDPHSGTHDMYITYNKAYNNNHGIICSVMCYNIHIENNEVYSNKADGIFLDSGSYRSVIANNIVHNQEVGIQLPSISQSQIYGNTIYDSKYGMKMYTQSASDHSCGTIGCGSVANLVHDNHIKAFTIAIEVKGGASSNTFTHNTLDGTNGDRGIAIDGSKTSNNIFDDNHISNAKYSIRVTGGNINSKFINNHLDTVAASGEYTLSGASALKLESAQFSSDVIRDLDSSSIPVSISKSGTISVVDGSTTKTYDTNSQAYTKTLTNNAKIAVTSGASVSSASTTSTFGTNTAPEAVLNDNISNSTLDKGSTKTSGAGNNVFAIKDSNNATSLQQQSAERQANLAQQQAEQQLGNNLKTDSKQQPQETDKSTEAQTENDGQGTKPAKMWSVDPNVSGTHVTRNEISDNSHSDNSPKNTDNAPKSSSSINGGQRLNHETLLTLKVTQGNGDGKYLLTGNLIDKTAARPLQGLNVFFTTDPPIKISNGSTNKAGGFKTNTLIAPGTGGIFKIQAHFGKVNHYDATDSKTIILKIKAEKASTPLGDPNSKNAAISHPTTSHGHLSSSEVNTITNNTSEAIR